LTPSRLAKRPNQAPGAVGLRWFNEAAADCGGTVEHTEGDIDGGEMTVWKFWRVVHKDWYEGVSALVNSLFGPDPQPSPVGLGAVFAQ
jgi:hypothetical protein